MTVRAVVASSARRSFIMMVWVPRNVSKPIKDKRWAGMWRRLWKELFFIRRRARLFILHAEDRFQTYFRDFIATFTSIHMSLVSRRAIISGERGPSGFGTGISSGVRPGNSSGDGSSPGSRAGGGTSGRGFPGGFSCGGSDGFPGLIGGSSCGSIGIRFFRSYPTLDNGAGTAMFPVAFDHRNAAKVDGFVRSVLLRVLPVSA
jgi:hypothetical protein